MYYTLQCNINSMKRGRPKYKITQSDFFSAYLYLERNYNDYSFQKLLRKIKTPEQLQSFCDDNLTTEQWKKLKTTIFAERKRNKDSVPGRQQKNITLSQDAFNQLQAFKNTLQDHTDKKYSYSDLIIAVFTHLNENMDVQSAIDLIESNRII